MAVVSNTNDTGAGSLRAALAAATPGEVITFSVTGTITLTSGHLTINQNQTVTGPGSGSLTISGGGTSRVFNVTGGIVTITGLTLSNGAETDGGIIYNETTLTLTDIIVTGGVADNGGGIYNTSTVTATDCEVTDCVASVDGGGIWNDGTITATNLDVTECEANTNGGGVWNSGTVEHTGGAISDNETIASSGGGIYNGGTYEPTEVTVDGNVSVGNGAGAQVAIGGTLTVVRSTFSNNDPIGIANVTGGTVNVDNSTLSGNTTGFYNAGFGSAEFLHSTISNNSFGIITEAGSVLNIQNCIVATNTSGDTDNEPGDIVSNGYNIFGSSTNPITPGTGDQFDVGNATLKLGPLQDNGGPTFTHALLTNSVALNAGTNAGAPETDQRGEPRIVNGTIDIGAYESQDIVCIEITGTLPAWLTVQGNCLAVAPNAFRGATKAEATAKAQAALDAWVAAALESGDMRCGPEECTAFEREEFSGTLTEESEVSSIFTDGGDHYMQRFTFEGEAGSSVAIWQSTFNLGFRPAVALLSPSLTVLETDRFAYGYNGGASVGGFRSAAITYTLPSTGTYTVEVSTDDAVATGAFQLVLSDGVESSITLDPSPWIMAYVETTKRIFVLHGWGGTECTVTVINSETEAIVNTVTLIAGLTGVFSPARPTMFYNPNDDSVWAGAMDISETFSNFHRLNPTTGAELEVIPLSVSTYNGAFVPSLNRVYDNRTLGFSISSIGVFDCATRTYGTNISLGGTFQIVGQRYLPEIDRVLIQSATQYWLINPNDNTISSAIVQRVSVVGFEKDSLYYTKKTNNPTALRVIDLLTGTVVTDKSFTSTNYNVQAMAYNECRECMQFCVINNQSPDGYLIVSAPLDTLVATESVIAEKTDDTMPWIYLLWNPDQNRMWCMFADGFIRITS